MPEVTTDADGSQDALVVRVAAGGHVGWGECEASPLVSIAAFVTPDVARRLPAGAGFGARRDARRARTTSRRSPRRSPTTAWTCCRPPHTWSGIEMALWDLLGQGARRAGLSPARLSHGPRRSALRLAAVRRHAAGDAGRRARAPRGQGFRAVKFGWGPFGTRRARGRSSTISTPRAKGSARTASCSSMPARSSDRRRRGRRRAPAGARTQPAPSGWRSRSTPAPTRPMRRSARGPTASGSPAARAPQRRSWPGT